MDLIVVDASFVLAFLLPDEETKELTSKLFADYAEGKVHLISTRLLQFEVLNALLTAWRRKRIDSEELELLIKNFQKLNISGPDIDTKETLALAKENDLTFYDASYLFLAKSKEINLFTFDDKLLKSYPKNNPAKGS